MSLLSSLTSTINNTDSYKISHFFQYPEGTQYVSSYIEARGSHYAKTFGTKYDFAEFFGLQSYLKAYLSKPIVQEDIDLMELMAPEHGLPFNKEGWQYILDKYQGKLPVEIRALPEGTVLPTSNALVEIINTDPKCYWLTSYVETELLRAVWYPTTVATKSRIGKEIIREFLDETAEDTEKNLQFMLHDFGARGVSSTESSVIGGMAHIVNFLGTDTFMSLIGVLAYYTPEYETLLAEAPDNPKRALIRLLKKMKAEKQPLPAFAVIAAEHSTMTIKGREGEKGQIKRLLDEARKRKTIVSIVLDSYDYYHNVGQVLGEEFKQDILEVGKNGGRIILRPDSGDPVDVIVKTLQIVDEKFGCTVNKKGYKVLPPYLRALQGDGIDIDTMLSILRSMKAAGFSAENVLFGMGAGIAQKVNRDDLYFAQKASAACINGVWGDVFKAPKTSAAKVSKKGRVSTVWDGITFTTKRTSELLPGEKDRMVTVFRNGELFNNQTFTQVRQTAEYFTRLYKGTEQPVKEPWEQALLNKNPSPGV